MIIYVLENYVEVRGGFRQFSQQRKKRGSLRGNVKYVIGTNAVIWQCRCKFSYLISKVKSSIFKAFNCRAREISDGGKSLTLETIKEICTEEFSILQINCPEKRSLHLSYAIIRKFADRWNLLEDQRTNMNRKRKYECDVCGKMLTTPKCVLDHKKSIHYPFLHLNTKYAQESLKRKRRNRK